MTRRAVHVVPAGALVLRDPRKRAAVISLRIPRTPYLDTKEHRS